MSNVIKFSQYTTTDDKKIVEVAKQTSDESFSSDNSEPIPDQRELALQEVNEMKEQILLDAQSYAEQQVQGAMAEIEELRSRAEAEVNEWWSMRRQQDEQHIESAKESGFEQGYQEGLRQAQQQMMQQYQEMLDQAKQVLEQSYQIKQQIVQESEPFLIELSCSIAEKVIARQLTLNPEWVKDMIGTILARRKEKGIITLCVSPAHFSYIQDAREELILHIDSQAELQIIPDASVTDQGCVVRSSFGSIDARIDTQLFEIKTALRQIALHNEEA